MAIQCSSWSDLPQEIVELIFDCAKDPIDILRCGAACRSWLPTALQVYPKFLRECFTVTGKVEDGTPVFLCNFLTKKARKIQVPEAKKNWVYHCRYSDSWLFIVDYKFPYRMQLLDLFSRTQINVPPLTSSPFTTTSFDPNIGSIISCPSNWKVLLSEPPLDSDCILFLLRGYSFAGFSVISSWKPGENKWSYVKIRSPEIYDAVLFKGKLYASVRDESTGEDIVITCNYQLEIEYEIRISESFQERSDGYTIGTALGDGFWVFNDSLCLRRGVNYLNWCPIYIGPNLFKVWIFRRSKKLKG